MGGILRKAMHGFREKAQKIMDDLQFHRRIPEILREIKKDYQTCRGKVIIDANPFASFFVPVAQEKLGLQRDRRSCGFFLCLPWEEGRQDTR